MAPFICIFHIPIISMYDVLLFGSDGRREDEGPNERIDVKQKKKKQHEIL